MSTLLLGFLIVGSSVVLAVLGLLGVRRLVKREVLQRHHDVAGFIIALVGVVYAVLQAFVVFVVWTEFQDAKSAVSQEADAIASLYRMAHGFPEKDQIAIRQQIQVYCTAVIEHEWPAMSVGKSDIVAQRAFNRLWEVYERMNPKTQREIALYSESLTRLNDVTTNRRARILASGDGLPNLFWFVLYFGGATTVVFTYFFGAENVKAQVAMTALLTAEIALVLFLIAAVDYPFRGDVRVTPEAFQNIMHNFTEVENSEASLDAHSVAL